jgi:hypothetical protein
MIETNSFVFLSRVPREEIELYQTARRNVTDKMDSAGEWP